MADRPTDIPALPPRTTNRQVRLVRRPSGIPVAEDFALGEDGVPALEEGTFLVRNVYLSVDPAQRGWASSEANYSAPIALGTPMRGLAVGVVEASRCPEVAEGEVLYGMFNWQDYAVARPEAIVLRARHAVPMAQFAGLFGINGLTAYLALTLCGRPEAGETLVVSTAAGGVGSLVGQIGKRLGCRTIGLTGSDDKAALCRTRYGYDVAVNYRAADVGEAVDAAAPDGVDVYFDNVGGTILDTVLRRMRVAGRIVQCGTASVASWIPAPTGPRNEREILTRRLVWSGFVIFDHMARLEEAAATLAAWYRAGEIDMALEVREGIEQAAGALADLYSGANLGKRLIRIA